MTGPGELEEDTVRILQDGKIRLVKGKICFEALEEYRVFFADAFVLYDLELIDYPVLRAYFRWYCREHGGDNVPGRYLKPHHHWLLWSYWLHWMKAAEFNHKHDTGDVSAEEAKEIRKFVKEYSLELKIVPHDNKFGFKVKGKWGAKYATFVRDILLKNKKI